MLYKWPIKNVQCSIIKKVAASAIIVPVKPSPDHKKTSPPPTKSAEGFYLPDHSFQGITGALKVNSL